MNDTANNHQHEAQEGNGQSPYPLAQQQEDLSTIADGMEAYAQLLRQVVKRMQEQGQRP